MGNFSKSEANRVEAVVSQPHGDEQHKSSKILDKKIDNVATTRYREETSFSNENKRYSYDQVNVRIPAELNDWLNEIVRFTKREHGTKIPKEILMEVAVEFLKSKNLNWSEIKTKEDISKQLSA